ncbi:MAG: sulfite exporter TauE/SafE family protein [Campylobacterales bacterium]
MSDYILFSIITFFLSIIFSMGGAGAGIALVPIFNFLGLDFTMAKAVGLFAGASTTITSSVMNLKRKVIDFAFVIPIAVGMMSFAPVGAYASMFIDENIVKFFFMLMLFYSASMMLFGKKKSILKVDGKVVMFAIGSSVGFLAGVLGVGGGNILIPLLILLGFEPKKVAVSVSFVVPFSTLGSFFTYLNFVDIDYLLLTCVAFSSIVGGYVGNYLMHFKLQQSQIKKLMGVILYLLAFKLLYQFIV